MKAVIAERYGGPEILQIEDVPVPQVGPNGVLVRVHASSVNPIDWKLRNGMLKAVRNFLFPVIWGTDFSGVVTEVGHAVTLFKPGDEVYGFKDGSVAKTYRGTYAEFAVVPEKSVSRKPANLTHQEAASLPVVALSAWQALITQGRLKPGDRVLIHAGAGGVGTIAVQLAKAFGAYVAATASGLNQQFLRELGADLPIDYEHEKIEDKISGCAIVLDGVGKSVWRSSLSVLRRGGKLTTLVVSISQGNAGKFKFITLVAVNVVAAMLRATLSGKRFMLTMVKPRGGDLEKLTALIEAGKIRPIVEKVYPLEQIADAQRASETGHVRGKIVVKIE
ncbi:MAG TPA: NADP-dependent oxidoreductase [Candidatus Angelobacter sp.]|nr:NADP-dependent oxidoreductase [Candidatus Angelobacter sp.]